VNDPESLLFSPPFQRIYENTYLLGSIDISILIQRARAIYDNFTDLLLDRQKALARSDPKSGPNSAYHVDQKVLAMEIRSLLFYWNTSSTRFDSILTILSDTIPGNYHLWGDGINFHVTNIDNNQEMLPRNWRRFILQKGIFPDDMGDSGEVGNPSGYLRPCRAFNIDAKEGLVTFPKILEDLKAKIVMGKEKGFGFEIYW
jgi:hypothetical protein